MSAWIKRFGLHLAAAVGATGIFVGAVAVGASQARQQEPAAVIAAATATREPRTPRPTVARSPVARASPSPAPSPSPSAAAAAPKTQRVVPERSLTGTIRDVAPDGLLVLGAGGRDWRVTPVPGALIRLNGKAARLETLQVGDTVVILGQAQAGQGPGMRFLAHAITARHK